MPTQSDFLQNILPKIENAKASFSDKKLVKKFQLKLLSRITKRVDAFSIECSECQSHKQEISVFASQLSGLPHTPKEQQRDYRKKIQNIIQHLRKKHKLIKQGQYIGTGVAIGVAIGTALNAALKNGAGIAIGIAIGLAIGSAQEAKAKKEGRVI